MYDVVIVGAGPAGMTAAIYALRNNLRVALVESNVPGGVVVNTAVVENYPGFIKIDGPTLAYSMFEQATTLGAEYYGLTVSGIRVKDNHFIVYTNEEELKGKTVILASGTKQRRLGVPGEEKYAARGISWCAICDGALYKGENVAVIGGGNSAFEETIYLSNLVKKVYLIHRREGFRAESSLIEKVRGLKNIEMVLNSQVIEFIGTETLQGIKIENIKTNEVKTIKVKGCFEFIGTLPSTDYLKDLGILAKNGYIKVKKNYETVIKGLFACGDVVNKEVRQIATAINDGAIAALSAIKYCS
ncbi:MAG: thioredoxin-disulfide reductase [Bacilli bacterium]|nr:thioredoxin-disulfide reductase [Bacilli bacterium]MDD4388690.1 thioredoxin-disulfide reductase [Bacilli bacterium]